MSRITHNSMREVHSNRVTSDDDADPGHCRRCGEPTPVDGACDCAGDVDRDRWMGLQGLRHDRIVTNYGARNRFGKSYVADFVDMDQ